MTLTKSPRSGAASTRAVYNISIETIATNAGTDRPILVTAAMDGLIGAPSDYKVHWDINGSPTVDGNDSEPVGPQEPGPNGPVYRHTVTVTQPGAGPTALTFTAKLTSADGGTTYATSSGKMINFLEMEEPEIGETDKFFAGTTTTGPHDDRTRIRLWAAYVTNPNNGDGIAGVEVRWRTEPGDQSVPGKVEFWKDIGTPPELGEPSPAVPADRVNRFPCTLTDEDGLAQVWVTSDQTHYFNLSMEMNGALSPPQTDIVFADMNAKLNPTYGPPAIIGDLQTDGLHPSPGQFQFDVQVATGGFLPQPQNIARVFFAVAQYTNAHTGDPQRFEYDITDIPFATTFQELQAIPVVQIPYADLMTPEEAALDSPPGGDMTKRNSLFYFIQDLGGDVRVSLRAPIDLAEDYENIPDTNPGLRRILGEASIQPYPGMGFITPDKLEQLGGINVIVPPPPAQYVGGKATLLVFINGYYAGTAQPHRGFYTDTQSVVASGAIFHIRQSVLMQYAVSALNQVGNVYFDYKIEAPGPGTAYSTYPHPYQINT